MDLPNEFFTWASFGTLGGAAGIVFVATCAVKYLLDGTLLPKWFAFVMSELVSFLGAFYAMATPEKIPLIVRIFIAVLNGLLIFVTALGVNTILTKTDGGTAGPVKGRKFLSRW